MLNEYWLNKNKGETGEGVSISDYKAKLTEKRSEYLSQQGISE
jgi:hypothetical protein